MKFSSVKSFEDPKRDASLVFLAQRLQELTHEYSLDSYKAPTTNIPALIQEGRAQIAFGAAHGEKELGSAKHIVEELCERLRGNPISNALVRHERNASGILRSGDVNAVSPLLNSLKFELSERAYTLKAIQLIEEQIEGGHKSQVDYLAREITSSLINLGMSRKFLNETVTSFFFKSRKNINNQSLKEFFKLVFPHHHKFGALFNCGLLTEALAKVHWQAFGLVHVAEIPDDWKSNNEYKKIELPGEKSFYLVVEDIYAFDPYSAADIGRKKVASLHNLFRAYHHKEDFALGEAALVRQFCHGNRIVSVMPDRRVEHVLDDRPEKATERLDGLLKTSRFPRSPDKSRFYSVLNFHSMSLDAKTIENQVINLWIALETIAPARGIATKIDNVSRAVVPAIGLDYFRKLVSRVAFDLLAWNKSAFTRTLSSMGEVEFPSLVHRVAALIVLEKYQSHRTKLFAALGNYELMRYRIFRLSEKFSTPSDLLEFISDHERRVEWQVRRIYRTRNAIVHQGVLPAYAGSIVDSAHDYFDQVMRLTNNLSCHDNGLEEYREMFDFITWEYETYKRRIKSIDVFNEDDVSTLLWDRPSVPVRAELI